MKMSLFQRVLTLVLLPTLLISLSFVLWFGSQQLANDRAALNSQLILSAERLENSLEYGLMTENLPLVEAIVQSALNEDNVRSINVLDDSGRPLVALGPSLDIPLNLPDRLQSQQFETDHSLILLFPVDHENAVYYPMSEALSTTQHWIVFELSKDRMVVQQYKTILFDLILLILAVATSILVALLVTRRITGPIYSLSKGLDRIISGDTTARIDPTGVTEIQAIGDNVNQLTKMLDAAYIELQTGIDQATHDIRETLETLEIQNIELDMARREALDASRIQSEFLANMSHEIRTPLNGIIGFANLLNKTHMSRKQEDYAKTIQSSAQNLLTIINDVLDFKKIEAGKLSLDNTPLNLKDLIEDVLVMVAPEAHRKQLELIPLYFQDVPTHILGDPLRIKQIVTNLVGNAIKFTHAGQVTVRCTLDNHFGGNVIIQVAVTDTGIGLSSDQKKALFKAFQQANTTTARAFGGTGLGLVICKKLVEQMGGDMGIDSKLGEGSTFWFTLRADLAEDSVAASPPDRPLSQKSLLLYEFNKTLHNSLLRTFEADGHRVTEAKNLSEWVSLAQNKKPDIAVLGFNSLTEVGDTFHHALARIKANGATQVVVLTNGFEDSIGMKLIEQNVHHCLSKPLKSDRLLQLLGQDCAVDFNDAIATRYQEGGRILAVDDNEANLKLICTLIEDHGITAVRANSGQAALDLLEKEQFDLILMDIQMPVMDGIETTRRLLRLPSQARQHTPIVAVTAHALDSEKEALLRQGFDAYLTKPLSDEQLVKTISQWTQLRLQTMPQLSIRSRQDSDELSTAADDTQATLDLQQALKRSNAKADLAIDMFESLIRQCEQDRNQIKQHFDTRDYAKLLEVVHKLHGATQYCGVPALRAKTETVEIVLKSGSYADLPQAIENLDAEIETLLAWQQDNDFAAMALEYTDKPE